MSLAPSLVRRTDLGGTIHMLVGDSNPRYLAELNGSRVYCDDMATAEAHLDFWSKALLHCWGRQSFQTETTVTGQTRILNRFKTEQRA